MKQGIPVSAKRNTKRVYQKFYISFKVDGAYERMNITKKVLIAGSHFLEVEFYIPYMFKFICRFVLNRGMIDPSVPFISSDLTLINKTTMDDAEHYLTMVRLNA